MADTPAAQEFPAAPSAFGQERLHRVLGDAEAIGDFPLGETLNSRRRSTCRQRSGNVAIASASNASSWRRLTNSTTSCPSSKTRSPSTSVINTFSLTRRRRIKSRTALRAMVKSSALGEVIDSLAHPEDAHEALLREVVDIGRR